MLRGRFVLAVAVVAVLAAVVAAALTGPGLFPSGGPVPSPEVTTAGGERATKGSPEAPVTIVEFSDFQCPFCGRFARQVAPQIDREYVETGKVRYIFRHFAFLGPESRWAAQAAECAGEQGQFWAYHDKLFANQAGENRGAFSKEKLRQFAAELGLDGDALSACLDSGRYAAQVQADIDEAQRRGVRATPTFFINGVKLEGAYPLATFREIIERALSEVP